MTKLKIVGLFALGVVLLIPAYHVLDLVFYQTMAWAWVCDLFKPNIFPLVVSAAYWIILLPLTGWYWLWRFFRWIFVDEGPLPKFRNLLLVLWLPVYLIPCVVLLSIMGWLGCWIAAYKLAIDMEKDNA